MRIDQSLVNNLIDNATSRLDVWDRVIRKQQPKVFAEVGVWRGHFAREILKRQISIEKYYMIDPWAPLSNWNKPLNVDASTFNSAYREALDKTDFASDKRIILRGMTKEVINQIPDLSLDFAYIDGDHTLRGITIDLIRIFPKLKEGGLIGGDDFTPNPWQHDTRFEPTLVCPFIIYFAEAMNLQVVALPYNQFIMEKRPNASFSFLDPTEKYKDLSLNKLAKPNRYCFANKIRDVIWNTVKG